MSWNRWGISQKHIFYDEHDEETPPSNIPFPPHADALRQCILDFSFPDLEIPNEEDTANSREEQSSMYNLPSPTIISYEAKHIHRGGYNERKWEEFFRREFFEPLVKCTEVLKGNTRRISRCNYYYDHFRLINDTSWTAFSGKADDTDDLVGFQKVKCPKPDFAFHLPLYHFDEDNSIPRIKSPSARQWQLHNSPLMETFSWSLHKKLHANGLRSSPIRLFQNEPAEATLQCYPWLIVEHKKEIALQAEVTVKCQAANDGACAIRLNQNAARYAVELEDSAHIPPIATITTNGSLVTVWVMYFAKDFQATFEGPSTSKLITKKCKQGYMMRDVWHGDVTLVDDIRKFQMILDNIHTWAMRVYKPLMSSHIQQWKSMHSETGIDSVDAAVLRQETMDRYQATVPTVQRVLDNYTNIELDSGEHLVVTPLLLSLLMKEIYNTERQVLIKEMDHLIAERLRGLNVSAGEWSQVSQTTTSTHVQRSEAFHSQLTILSRVASSNNDDPKDSDYAQSQTTDDPDDAEGDQNGGVRGRRLVARLPLQNHTTPVKSATRKTYSYSFGEDDDEATPKAVTTGVIDLTNAPSSSVSIAGSTDEDEVRSISHEEFASQTSPFRRFKSRQLSQVTRAPRF